MIFKIINISQISNSEDDKSEIKIKCEVNYSILKKFNDSVRKINKKKNTKNGEEKNLKRQICPLISPKLGKSQLHSKRTYFFTKTCKSV